MSTLSAPSLGMFTLRSAVLEGQLGKPGPKVTKIMRIPLGPKRSPRKNKPPWHLGGRGKWNRRPYRVLPLRHSPVFIEFI